MRCTPMRCMLMRYTPIRCTPMRCTPMRCMPMRCMNRENFDLSLSIPRRTPGQGGVGPSVRICRRRGCKCGCKKGCLGWVAKTYFLFSHSQCVMIDIFNTNLSPESLPNLQSWLWLTAAMSHLSTLIGSLSGRDGWPLASDGLGPSDGLRLVWTF